MSNESKALALPTLPDVQIYRADGPRGLLRIAVQSDTSVLAERLYQMWRLDGLPELAQSLKAERERYAVTGKTRCHEVAYDFAYGAAINVQDPDHPALLDWTWCVGETNSRDTHSWVEHLGEAFDSAMVQADGEAMQVLWVRQASDLRAFYQAAEVESRTFKEFVDWMGARREKLFERYPVVDRFASDMRRAGIESGRVIKA